MMKNATYGRMRIGRCITAEEVDGLGSRHLGCSANVLTLLDNKCSGMTECDIRVVEISDHTVKPCFPGLTVYLEASYDCITSKSFSLLESSNSIFMQEVSRKSKVGLQISGNLEVRMSRVKSRVKHGLFIASKSYSSGSSVIKAFAFHVHLLGSNPTHAKLL